MTDFTKSVIWIQVERGILKELLIIFFPIITDFHRRKKKEMKTAILIKYKEPPSLALQGVTKLTGF